MHKKPSMPPAGEAILAGDHKTARRMAEDGSLLFKKEYLRMQQYHFSTSKILLNVIIYFVLFLSGDFTNSVIFDGMFSVVTLPGSEWYIILRMTGCLLVTILFFWIYTTKHLHLKLADFGITFQVKLWGVALSILLPAFVVIAFLIISKAECGTVSFSDMILVIIASIITALKAGILEEMLFRGFIMRLLENRWGKPLAILLPSVLFSLAHIPSMESFTVGGVVLLVISGTLIGVMFSLIAYRGNSISNNALIHSMWNLVMVTDILHITTAQGTYGKPLIQILISSDNILLTGAGFGSEASLIAIIGYLLVCGIVIWNK